MTIRIGLLRRAQTLSRAREVPAWARHVADRLGVPLATVLAWPLALLEAEIARAIVGLARDRVRLIVATDPPGPAPVGTDLVSQAARALYAQAMAERQAQEAVEQDALFDALLAQQNASRKP